MATSHLDRVWQSLMFFWCSFEQILNKSFLLLNYLPFLVNVFILIPPENTKKTLWFSGVFRGFKTVLAKSGVNDQYSHREIIHLTHLFPMHLSLPPEDIKKPYGFLIISGGRERLHWEQMG